MKFKNKIIMMLLVCASMCAISIPALAYDFGDAGITPYEYNTAMVLPMPATDVSSGLLAVTPMSYEGDCTATGSISDITVSGNNITFTATLSEDYVPYMFPVGHEYYSANGYYYLRVVPINNGVNGSAVPYFCNMVTELTDTFIGDFTTYDAYKIELYCYCEGSGVAYVDGHLLDKDYINALGHLCQPFNFLSKNEAGANHTYMHLFDTTLTAQAISAEYTSYIASINNLSEDYIYVTPTSSNYFALWMQYYNHQPIDTVWTIVLDFDAVVYESYKIRLFLVEDTGFNRTMTFFDYMANLDRPYIADVSSGIALDNYDFSGFASQLKYIDSGTRYFINPTFNYADYASTKWFLGESYSFKLSAYEDIKAEFNLATFTEITKLNDIDIETYFANSYVPYIRGFFENADYIPLFIYVDYGEVSTAVPLNFLRTAGITSDEFTLYSPNLTAIAEWLASGIRPSNLSANDLKGLSSQFIIANNELIAPVVSEGTTYSFKFAKVLNADTYESDGTLELELVYEEAVAFDDFENIINDVINYVVGTTGDVLGTIGTIGMIALLGGAVLLLVFIIVIIVRFIRFIVRFGRKKNKRY